MSVRNIFNRSALRTENELLYLESPEIARIPWVRHGFLTRKGGVSLPPYDTLNLGRNSSDDPKSVSRNRDLIAATFGFDRNRLILLDQRHGDGILVLKEPIHELPLPLEYDALITNASDLFLGILTADCVPILVVDPRRKVIAAIHAGRNGTALHVTSKCLKTMRDEFGSSIGDLRIAMGPSIGSCCYEIDRPVFQSEWEPFSASAGEGRWRIDLARINLHQMEKEGVNQAQVDSIDLCTRCHPDLFFSYRGEGKTGRQLSFIGMTE